MVFYQVRNFLEVLQWLYRDGEIKENWLASDLTFLSKSKAVSKSLTIYNIVLKSPSVENNIFLKLINIKKPTKHGTTIWTHGYYCNKAYQYASKKILPSSLSVVRSHSRGCQLTYCSILHTKQEEESKEEENYVLLRARKQLYVNAETFRSIHKGL